MPEPVSRKGKRLKFDELGCGHYGCVIETNEPDVVFKLTTDTSEAAFVAAALTLTEWPAGMVRYYDIFELPETHRKRRVFVLWRQEAFNVGEIANAYRGGAAAARYADKYGERSVKEFTSNIRQWQVTAGAMRNQMTRVKEPEVFLESAHAEADRAWALYADDRAFKMGPSLYGEPRMKMVAYGHKGPLAFELRRIQLEQLAMEMANTHAGYLIGQALGFYLEEGMLLADVHMGNLGEIVPEDHEKWELVITDPGHMVPLDTKWLNLAIRML